MQENTLKYINFHISRPAAAVEEAVQSEQQVDFDFKGIESMDTDAVIQQNLTIISYL